LLAGVVVLGALLRFTTLDRQSFWYDEAVTWGIVRHGLGHVLSTVPRSESTPPLYYVLLWLWSRVFGVGGAGLRAFSALCSTLTIPVVWAIGRRLVSNRVGLIAALLTAVNPFLFWYAQEARSYSMLLLMCALSLLALVWALESPGRGRVLVWGIVSALAVATHYYAAVVIAPEGLWLATILHRRGLLTRARVALGAAPIAIVGGALIPLAIRQNDGRAGYIATKGGSMPYRLAQLVKQDIIGDGQPHKVLLTVIGCAAVLAALALLVMRAARRERSAALMMTVIGVAGVLLALVVATVGTNYFNTRNLIPTWPAVMLVVAIGLGAVRGGRMGAITTAVLVVLSGYCIWNIVSNPWYQRTNWRGAARSLGPATSPRVIVADIQGEIPLLPYLPDLAVDPAGGVPVREVDLVWTTRATNWGPITPITPAPLPGFPSVREMRTSSYVVVRYRASAPTRLAPAAVSRIYPDPTRALALVEPPG
jgi:hypothetical protein